MYLNPRFTLCVRGISYLQKHKVSVISRALSSSPEGAQLFEKIHAPTLNGQEKNFPSHIVKIVDDIAKLTLLEVSDLNELLSKRLNIKAPAHSMAFMTAQQSTASSAAKDDTEEEQAPTKSSFSIKLMKFDATKKVALIKEIKNIVPEMNLVQAKKFVEAAPGVLKSDLSKDEAESWKKALEACGGSVELE